MAARRLGVAAALVDGEVLPGDVTVADGCVAAVGCAPAGHHGVAVPGFIDVQVNGFAGVDFTHADTGGYADALAAMARHGVTWCAPTIPTAAPQSYPAALATIGRVLLERPDGAKVLGAHLEGPFLNPARRGAHRAGWLRSPDEPALHALLDAGPVALLTLAPELPGATQLIAAARRRGVVVALGHSDADRATAHAAFDTGATMVTHLWNAQRPITAREPALAGVALARPDVHVGIIADLVHLAAETVQLSLAAAGGRAFVVTDGLHLAGQPPGTYRQHGRTLVSDGVAIRLADGTLAGSATPLDAALRNLVTLGLAWPAAVDHITRAPAAALQRPELGRLRVGGSADITVLDDRLEVRATLIDGAPLA
jgi:N-acetylglucosamine-6-phosphate deacetylase